MTAPAPERRTTPEGSQSQTPRPEAPAATPAGVTAPAPGFRPPPMTRSTSTASASGSSPSSAAAADPLAHDDPGPTDTPSASERERPAPEPLRLRKDGLNETARGLVLALALGVHHTLARSEQEVLEGLWLMDEAEAGRIGDPLAAIAQRRAGGVVVDPDMGDLIRAGTAAAGYVARNLVRAVQIRIAQRRARRAGSLEEQEQAA